MRLNIKGQKSRDKVGNEHACLIELARSFHCLRLFSGCILKKKAISSQNNVIKECTAEELGIYTNAKRSSIL